MAGVDFSKCDQPDELLQLAWNAGLDRKALIREGIDAAELLLAGERNSIVTMFWPVPRPLEAVKRWSENPSTSVYESVRPFASAVVPGCVLGPLVSRLFANPRTWHDSGLSALVWITVATIIALGLLFKLLIGSALRRRAARLDEQTALDLVLEQLRLGMVANPGLAPRAVTWIRREIEVQTSGPR